VDAATHARLRWRARRGMKELDVLLARYLEHDYARAATSEREAFARLLDLQDPELFGYLLGGVRAADDSFRHVIARIRHDP
jgi:antitoxin CptB